MSDTKRQKTEDGERKVKKKNEKKKKKRKEEDFLEFASKNHDFWRMKSDQKKKEKVMTFPLFLSLGWCQKMA